MVRDWVARILVMARTARDHSGHSVLHGHAAGVRQNVVQEVLSQHGRRAVSDHDVSAAVHVQLAHQDGAPLDHQPEICRGDPGVLLQYLAPESEPQEDGGDWPGMSLGRT